jgi:hypothetical protein
MTNLNNTKKQKVINTEYKNKSNNNNDEDIISRLFSIANDIRTQNSKTNRRRRRLLPATPSISRTHAAAAAAAVLNNNNTYNTIHNPSDTFIIYTAGLANWGFNEKIYAKNIEQTTQAVRLINYFKSILESILTLTFGGRFRPHTIHLYHFDVKFSPIQTTYLLDLSSVKGIEQYTVKQTVYNKYLIETDTEDDIVRAHNKNHSIVLDFSHEADIRSVKQIYFGYFDETRSVKDFEIIKHCKFINITPRNTLETYIDKLGLEYFKNISNDYDTGIFRSLPDGCIPSSAITIPNVRTQYQFGGIDPRDVFGRLIWEEDNILEVIDNINRKITRNILEIKHDNTTKTENCILCSLIKCESYSPFPSSKLLPNLCTLCNKLSSNEDTLYTAVIANNPK